jgi:nitroreductase
VDRASIDRLLTTTRTVRRRLDLTRPVDPAVIEECLAIAQQAPTAGYSEGWHFVVVTEPSLRAGLADIYRRARARYHADPPAFLRPPAAAGGQGPASRTAGAAADGRRVAGDPRAAGDPRVAQRARMRAAGTHLAEHLQDVPVLVLACLRGRVEEAGVFAQATFYGSILPAAWSFMLALRARGLGAAWTTDHLLYEREAADLLGIPPDVTQAVLLAVAYHTGDDFSPAPRLPVAQVTSWNRWGARR